MEVIFNFWKYMRGYYSKLIFLKKDIMVVCFKTGVEIVNFSNPNEVV